MTEGNQLGRAIDIAASIAIADPATVGTRVISQLGAALRFQPGAARPSVTRNSCTVIRPMIVIRGRWRVHLRALDEPGSGAMPFAVHIASNPNLPPGPSELTPMSTTKLVRLHAQGRQMLVSALSRELSRRLHASGDRDLLRRHTAEIEALRAAAYVIRM